jgi:hypothetical protein
LKAHIVYDADGTRNMWIKGYQISVQSFPGGRALIVVYNKTGKQEQAIHIAKYYSIDKAVKNVIIVSGERGSGRTQELMLWLISGWAANTPRVLIVSTRAEQTALTKQLQTLWNEDPQPYLNKAANSIFTQVEWVNGKLRGLTNAEIALSDLEEFLARQLRINRPVSMVSVTEPTQVVQLTAKTPELATETE